LTGGGGGRQRAMAEVLHMAAMSDVPKSSSQGACSSTSSPAVERRENPHALRSHDLKEKVFFGPTWCDNCGGVLIGDGWQCMGPCGRKCHRGLGMEAENCHADLCCTPCEKCVALTAKMSPYQFGDVSKQLMRNLKSRVKEQIVEEAVQEQKKFGRLDKIKEVAVGVRKNWDDKVVIWWLFVVQVGLVLLAQLVSHTLVLMVAWPMHGARGWRLAAYGASESAAVFIFVEAALILLARLLARQLLRYSDIIHAFMLEIMHIDLLELDIDLLLAAEAVLRVTECSLWVTCALWVASLANWIAEMRLA